MNPVLPTLPSNPFALLLAPEAVIAQIAASKHLSMLNSRVCRPLDKIVPGQDGEGDADDGRAAVAASND